MPMRDHFRPPTSLAASWEEVHGGWPMVIVQQLFRTLPAGYVAAPRTRLGSLAEVDIGTFDQNSSGIAALEPLSADGNGSTATALLAPPRPTLEVAIEIPEQDEFEVRIYDQTHDRTLVAAIEIVSPGNKDRPENRRAFASKCAALLRKQVCVSIVDLVTDRHFNLYTDLLDLIGTTDPAMSPNPPAVYAVTCSNRKRERHSRVAIWAYPLAVGQALPQLPIWLTDETKVMLDLEASYEETCRYLHIP